MTRSSRPAWAFPVGHPAPPTDWSDLPCSPRSTCWAPGAVRLPLGAGPEGPLRRFADLPGLGARPAPQVSPAAFLLSPGPWGRLPATFSVPPSSPGTAGFGRFGKSEQTRRGT